MELKDTIEIMQSSDYKDRFKAEYYQLKIRREKLMNMISKWDNNELPFTPTVNRSVYTEQIYFMSEYLRVLRKRAIIEDIKLEE